MTDQLMSEDLISIEQAMRLIPGKPSTATGFRYILKGARGIDGNRHKLETIKVLKKRWTSEEAVHRFIRAINTPASVEVPPPEKARGKQAATAKSQVEELLGV